MKIFQLLPFLYFNITVLYLKIRLENACVYRFITGVYWLNPGEYKSGPGIDKSCSIPLFLQANFIIILTVNPKKGGYHE